MARYAAYGSNMDPRQMQQRAPHSPMTGTGWLTGWRLTFGGEDLGWEGSLATVVEDPGSSVFVVLYDLTDADESALDSWEGALGVYRKIRVRIDTLDGDPLAWLYVLDAYEGDSPRLATWASPPTLLRPPEPPTTTSRRYGPAPVGRPWTKCLA